VKLVNNLLTRFEFRRDLSDKPFFANADGGTLKNQNTFIIGISYPSQAASSRFAGLQQVTSVAGASV
jgi:hypothetical protein